MTPHVYHGASPGRRDPWTRGDRARRRRGGGRGRWGTDCRCCVPLWRHAGDGGRVNAVPGEGRAFLLCTWDLFRCPKDRARDVAVNVPCRRHRLSERADGARRYGGRWSWTARHAGTWRLLLPIWSIRFSSHLVGIRLLEHEEAALSDEVATPVSVADPATRRSGQQLRNQHNNHAAETSVAFGPALLKPDQ